MWSVSMQTPTMTMRLSGGASRIAWSMMPGTPIASNSTTGRGAPTRFHASIADSSSGVTTSCAPIAAAIARRRAREVRRDDRLDALRLQRGDHREPDRSATEHERAFAGLDPRLVDRVQPTVIGSVERGARGVEPVRDLEAHARGQPHAVRVGAVVGVREPDRLETRGPASANGIETTRSPTATGAPVRLRTELHAPRPSTRGPSRSPPSGRTRSRRHPAPPPRAGCRRGGACGDPSRRSRTPSPPPTRRPAPGTGSGTSSTTIRPRRAIAARMASSSVRLTARSSGRDTRRHRDLGARARRARATHGVRATRWAEPRRSRSTAISGSSRSASASTALLDPGSFHEVGALTGRGTYDDGGELTALTPRTSSWAGARVDGRTGRRRRRRLHGARRRGGRVDLPEAGARRAHGPRPRAARSCGWSTAPAVAGR